MRTSQPNKNLIAQEKAIEAAALAIGLAGGLPPYLKSLQNQIIRAADSVASNLGEGAGRTGRDRRHFWKIAYGSAIEVDIHIQILIKNQNLEAEECKPTLELYDRVRAMTWRLIQSVRC